MSDLQLTSGSRAEDASYRALADAVQAAGAAAVWRIAGGHMVNLHAARTGVALPARATRDADLAVDLLSIRAGRLLDRLRDLGYASPRSRNRFERKAGGQSLTIDLLAPSYTNKHVPNMDAGQIAVDGIPALHVTLSRPPLLLEIEVSLSGGDPISIRAKLPDLASAIAVKVFSYAGRFAARDAEDLRRLLEAARLDRIPWPDSSTFQEAGSLLSEHFDSPGRGLRHMAATTAEQTRSRALARSLLSHRDDASAAR